MCVKHSLPILGFIIIVVSALIVRREAKNAPTMEDPMELERQILIERELSKLTDQQRMGLYAELTGQDQ